MGMDAGRRRRLAEDNLKLFAVFRVIAPLAFHLDDFTWSGIDDVPEDGYQLSPAIDLDFGDSITCFFTGEGDSLDLTLKISKIIGRH